MGRRRRRADGTGPLAFGLMLMALGTLMMFDRFEMVDGRPWWKFWPLGLVFLGTARWLSPDREGPLEGLGMVAAGSVLLAHNLDVMRLHQSWPLFLVAGGAAMVAQAWTDVRRPVAPEALDAPAEETRHDR